MLVFNHKCLVKELRVRNPNYIQPRCINPANTNCKGIKLLEKEFLEIKWAFFFQYFGLSKFCYL